MNRRAAASRTWAWATLLTVLFTLLLGIFPAAERESSTAPNSQAQRPRPIRALYVTGGGFHEFVKQQDIVPPAVAKTVNIAWTIDHTAGTSTEVLIERHRNTELYELQRVWPSMTPLAQAFSVESKKNYPLIWTNTHGKARVFVTSLGHNTEMIADPIYLAMVTRGLLWTVDKLQNDGTPAPGYAAR